MSLEVVVDRLWDGTPAAPDEAFTVQFSDGGDHLLVHVDAPFHGDPPPAESAGPLWGLWKHEVVEVFISGFGAPEPYVELELGPYGHHLLIQLAGEREVLASCLPLHVDTEIVGDRWRAVARLPRDVLPLPPHHLNVYAIHGEGDGRRYLAWSPVPGERPDYHRLRYFRPVTLP